MNGASAECAPRDLRRERGVGIGSPFMSSSTIGAIFVAASGPSIFARSPTMTIARCSGSMYFCATRTTSSFVTRVDRRDELLVVVLRQALRVDRRDAAVHAARPRRSCPAGSARDSPSPAPSLRHSAGAGRECPRSSFMNSISALSLFAVTMSPPARNGPGPRPNAKPELTP